MPFVFVFAIFCMHIRLFFRILASKRRISAIDLHWTGLLTLTVYLSLQQLTYTQILMLWSKGLAKKDDMSTGGLTSSEEHVKSSFDCLLKSLYTMYHAGSETCYSYLTIMVFMVHLAFISAYLTSNSLLCLVLTLISHDKKQSMLLMTGWDLKALLMIESIKVIIAKKIENYFYLGLKFFSLSYC